MRKLLFILEKEFRQIFRNKAMLPIIFVMPIIQLLILSFAVDYEIKNLKVTIVDQDRSVESAHLINKFQSNDYFILTGVESDPSFAFEILQKRQTDVVLLLPQEFGKRIISGKETQILLQLDAIDGSKAGVAASYSAGIIQAFTREMVKKGIHKNHLNIGFVYGAEMIPLNMFNPFKNYKVYMVPGILVVLITMIGAFLSSMNIVREKELGTIEQINVTPIAKYQFILGKTIPFWIIGMIELTIGLIVAVLVFDIHIVGNIGVIYLFASIYMVLILGFGLLISTITNTQQQAMFISWFFLVLFLLMGGLFTPIENMPHWAQQITYFNPIRFFIEVSRGVILRGAGLSDLQFQFQLVTLYAIILMAVAVFKYKKYT